MLKQAFKRVSFLFSVCLVLLFAAALALYRLAAGGTLSAAAANQQSVTVTPVSLRGTIYDRNLDPLTGNGVTEYPAAAVPDPQTVNALKSVLSADGMNAALKIMKSGGPFTLMLPKSVAAPGIRVFPVKSRYDGSGLAEHVVGSLNGDGHGISGVEKAFDPILSAGGRIRISYPVDALGHVLTVGSGTVEDTSAESRSGVALTLDRSIQQLTERAAAKYLKKGAAVVLEVPTGKILAAASLPVFPQNDVSSVLQAADSPLLNRAAAAYSVGSVFKLTAAAAALEDGISPSETYCCTGSITVDGQAFHCFGSEAHGTEDMKQAVAQSCNTYFVHLMQQVPPARFLRMAEDLGFGRAVTLAPGMDSAAGVLPSLSSLAVPRALANFSFGQGDLTATPLQIAAMVNAIASGGVFTQPSLVSGRVDAQKNIVEQAKTFSGRRVMSEQTAALLRSFMKASVDSGTGRRGKPHFGTAGAKTATAQTGRFVNGRELDDLWFTGFYPYDKPKYVIVVLSEGGDTGGTTCGPVFRAIADGLYGYVN